MRGVLLQKHEGGEAHHDQQVHGPQRNQQQHQSPAAAQAESGMVGAYAQIPEPAPERGVVEELRQR